MAPDSLETGTDVCRKRFCFSVVATGLRPDTDNALSSRTGARIRRMVDARGWSHSSSSSTNPPAGRFFATLTRTRFFVRPLRATTTLPEAWSNFGALQVAAYLAALVTAMPRLGPLPSGMHTIRAARAPGAAS